MHSFKSLLFNEYNNSLKIPVHVHSIAKFSFTEASF